MRRLMAPEVWLIRLAGLSEKAHDDPLQIFKEEVSDETHDARREKETGKKRAIAHNLTSHQIVLAPYLGLSPEVRQEHYKNLLKSSSKPRQNREKLKKNGPGAMKHFLP